MPGTNIANMSRYDMMNDNHGRSTYSICESCFWVYTPHATLLNATNSWQPLGPLLKVKLL